jgi:malate dehydrogenase (oxaloacetate-decarboxylating)(NADP+)
MDEDTLREAALDYHRLPTPGKISVTPTKGLLNQLDLSLAYSPGVAFACTAIEQDPQEAATLTSRSNLVGVITNGTAVLGLGNIGPLASKPVMEGKGCLFKKFAGIDVFDIEVAENDPDKFIDIVAALEPTFGAINLEDIKAPECFKIERTLRERMKIPVFHDDQHGTAIIVAAAVINGLRLAGKDIREAKLATSGAGAAALACLDQLCSLGLKRENIFVSDIDGVVYEGRTAGMDPEKQRYAQPTSARTLADIVNGADIFLGLSAGNVLKPEMIRDMAPTPIIMALANPTPEIPPELAREVRPDALICTGRSDYPNQVNNVLCFPFIFRGALDVGASAINEEMKKAAVTALADLTHAEVSDIVAAAYAQHPIGFGPDYLIPKPFDPRLIEKIAPAVAKAAMDSGVASRPITDMKAYRQRLAQFVYRSGASMKPVFDLAKASLKRVLYAEGEEEHVLRAAQVVVDEDLAYPVLIGRTEIIEQRIERYGLRLRLGENCEAVNILSDPRYRDLVSEYFELTKRKGITFAIAREAMRTRPTLIGAMLLRRGETDAMLCGTNGVYAEHLRAVRDVIGTRPGVKLFAAMNMIMLPERQIFICDTQVNHNPTADQLAEITLLAADELRRFGLQPRIAMLSHSSFGSSESPNAQTVRDALAILDQTAPDLDIEGEMQGDAALSSRVLESAFSGARLTGNANLLVMPNLDAANIAHGLLRVAVSNGITVGPILLGAAKPVHIVDANTSVRRIVNMTALAAADAAAQRLVEAGEG